MLASLPQRIALGRMFRKDKNVAVYEMMNKYRDNGIVVITRDKRV